LLPDVPASYYEDLNEEPVMKLLWSSLQHLEEVEVSSLFNINGLPARSAEGVRRKDGRQSPPKYYCTVINVAFYTEVSPPE
jgi:hypothetical protein